MQLRHECSDGLLIADEIVVDKIDMAAIAQSIKLVELRQHLVIGFGARYPTVKLNDVAEFASERTPA